MHVLRAWGISYPYRHPAIRPLLIGSSAQAYTCGPGDYAPGFALLDVTIHMPIQPLLIPYVLYHVVEHEGQGKDGHQSERPAVIVQAHRHAGIDEIEDKQVRILSKLKSEN